jgi:hypothetical protein
LKVDPSVHGHEQLDGVQAGFALAGRKRKFVHELVGEVFDCVAENLEGMSSLRADAAPEASSGNREGGSTHGYFELACRRTDHGIILVHFLGTSVRRNQITKVPTANLGTIKLLSFFSGNKVTAITLDQKGLLITFFLGCKGGVKGICLDGSSLKT